MGYYGGGYSGGTAGYPGGYDFGRPGYNPGGLGGPASGIGVRDMTTNLLIHQRLA